MVKNPPANAGDTGSSPGPGRATKIPHAVWHCQKVKIEKKEKLLSISFFLHY